MVVRAEGDGPFERTAGPEAFTDPGHSLTLDHEISASGAQIEENIDMHLDVLVHLQ